jgi:hypothetical protein
MRNKGSRGAGVRFIFTRGGSATPVGEKKGTGVGLWHKRNNPKNIRFRAKAANQGASEQVLIFIICISSGAKSRCICRLYVRDEAGTL